jgi:hypothetical protein
MYLLLLTTIGFISFTIYTLKRARRIKYTEIQFQNLHFEIKGGPTFVPSISDFTPVRLKVDNMFATLEAPSKSLKRIHYTLPR